MSVSKTNLPFYFPVPSSICDTFIVMSFRYELKVQASDGRFDTLASVEIVVEESADSGIRFSKDFYTASVKENDNSKQNLVVIQPVAESLNHQFAFGLLNNHDMFTVGETSGVVQTLGVPFDREQLDNYTVVVEV